MWVLWIFVIFGVGYGVLALWNKYYEEKQKNEQMTKTYGSLDKYKLFDIIAKCKYSCNYRELDKALIEASFVEYDYSLVKEGIPILFFAIESHDTYIVDKLMRHYLINPNTFELLPGAKEKTCPLFYCVGLGYTEMVQTLLDYEHIIANPINRNNVFERSVCGVAMGNIVRNSSKGEDTSEIKDSLALILSSDKYQREKDDHELDFVIQQSYCGNWSSVVDAIRKKEFFFNKHANLIKIIGILSGVELLKPGTLAELDIKIIRKLCEKEFYVSRCIIDNDDIKEDVENIYDVEEIKNCIAKRDNVESMRNLPFPILLYILKYKRNNLIEESDLDEYANTMLKNLYNYIEKTPKETGDHLHGVGIYRAYCETFRLIANQNAEYMQASNFVDTLHENNIQELALKIKHKFDKDKEIQKDIRFVLYDWNNKKCKFYYIVENFTKGDMYKFKELHITSKLASDCLNKKVGDIIDNKFIILDILDEFVEDIEDENYIYYINEEDEEE